jgi:hypothetical protein
MSCEPGLLSNDFNRQMLGTMISRTADTILTCVAGAILRDLKSEDGSYERFWPADANHEVIAAFPASASENQGQWTEYFMEFARKVKIPELLKECVSRVELCNL